MASLVYERKIGVGERLSLRWNLPSSNLVPENPWEGKMRDPGNEVGLVPVRLSPRPSRSIDFSDVSQTNGPDHVT